MYIRACNFLLVLLLMEERCWSKLSSESIMIPSKVSGVLVVIVLGVRRHLYIRQLRFLCLEVTGSYHTWL